jgi:hypothetical protein
MCRYLCVLKFLKKSKTSKNSKGNSKISTNTKIPRFKKNP